MTKYEFEARQLIGTWLAKQKITPIRTMRHVHPRCYVVGKAAESCLIVARPWKDSEEHMKVRTKKFPLDVIHTFDADLDAGDWCATAYVCHAGVQETVAVGWKK